MSMRHKSKLVAGVAIGMVLAMSAGAVAQGVGAPPANPAVAPSPAAPSAPVAAPMVAPPVVPTAPAQNPGALAAIEQSATPATAAPAQTSVAPGAIVQTSGPASYVVPPAGPGIFQGSEQTLREMSYLKTEVALNTQRKEHVESVMALEAAKKDLSDQLSGKSKDDKSVAGGGTSAPGPLPSGGNMAMTAVNPEPYVNSVYGYGNDMYAEIVVGRTKVLATKGTVLLDGSRVISVSNSGVTISSKGRSKKLAIRGSAGF